MGFITIAANVLLLVYILERIISDVTFTRMEANETRSLCFIAVTDLALPTLIDACTLSCVRGAWRPDLHVDL